MLDSHVVRQGGELTKSWRSRAGSRTACRLQPLLQTVAPSGTEGPQRAVKPPLPCIKMAALSRSPDLPEGGHLYVRFSPSETSMTAIDFGRPEMEGSDRGSPYISLV